MPVAGWMIWTALGVLLPTVAIQMKKDELNLFLMGFFRDIGRHKAYQRRYGSNSMALMTVLLKKEDPLLGFVEDDYEEDNNVPIYAMEELFEYGSGQDDSALLISIFGRIYDVSEGEKFYGPTGPYGIFPGHDVTYALGTGCKKEACLQQTADELNEKQLDESKRWLSFFQLHDKYPYVGKLNEVPVEALMNEWIDESIAKYGEEEMMKPPIP